MDTSPESMLSEVNKAIYAIMVTGQEYRIKDRYLRRADLSMLRQLRNELESQLISGCNNGLMDGAYVAVFDRR